MRRLNKAAPAACVTTNTSAVNTLPLARNGSQSSSVNLTINREQTHLARQRASLHVDVERELHPFVNRTRICDITYPFVQ
jgi:hypothetical protein